MKSKYKTKDLGTMTLFVSVGIILQYIENIIYISPVPGGKIGLCNVVSIINIFMFGSANALVISLLRAFLGTVLSGGITALPYSMFGTFFSICSMCLVKKYCYPKLSMIGMSVIGASVHNMTQICVASVMVTSYHIFTYLPFLLVIAVMSGMLTGYCAQVYVHRLLKLGDKNE